MLGAIGENFFKERGLRIETTGRAAFESWLRPSGPLCAAGVPLEDPSQSAAVMPTALHLRSKPRDAASSTA